MEGQIVKIVSDLHYVKYKNDIYPCKCRGVLRHNHILPVVGDYVLFDAEQLIINEIKPRKNTFTRPKVSNINKVTPIIVITKKDLLDEEDDYLEIINYYKKIGYKVLYNTNIIKIKELLKDKISVFIGQTGAGKSTLINRLNKELKVETGEVSISLGRGRHTTRETSMYELGEGYVIDTPGFSALDLKNYSKEEIRDSFIEFNNYKCGYRNCMHKNTENCGVLDAVRDNNIIVSRYRNYLKFIGDDISES